MASTAPKMMSYSPKVPVKSSATSIYKATAKAKIANQQANQVTLKKKVAASKPAGFSSIAQR